MAINYPFADGDAHGATIRASHNPPSRGVGMLRTLTLATVLAATVALAAPARADDPEFLTRLERSHVSYVSPSDALAWGRSVCDQLRDGQPLPSVFSALQNGGGFTNRDAGAIIGAATSELCTDQYQTAMDWARGQLG